MLNTCSISKSYDSIELFTMHAYCVWTVFIEFNCGLLVAIACTAKKRQFILLILIYFIFHFGYGVLLRKGEACVHRRERTYVRAHIYIRETALIKIIGRFYYIISKIRSKDQLGKYKFTITI